jgi:hypothetical protein
VYLRHWSLPITFAPREFRIMSKLPNIKITCFLSLLFAGTCGLAACGSDSGDGGVDPDSPLTPKPECEGVAVTPLAGTNAMVFSGLALGRKDDGFDLDGDGEPDNQFAGVASLANPPIKESFEDMEVVLPMEFFDLAEIAPDDCVKFAIYQGNYRLDLDEDGKDTVKDNGDCNDHVATISPNLPEIPDNGMDDNCNGLADETVVDTVVTPSADTSDGDADGVTLADGDCDDTNAMVKPGMDEICGDGLDNDCDGTADYTLSSATPVCSPYDDELDPIMLADASFNDDGSPLIAFKNGTIEMVDGVLRLHSGPSLFTLTLPITAGIELELSITGTTIEADVVMTPGGWILENGRLGGVIDAYNMDKVRGLDVEEIGLKPEDSLADAMYTNILGVLLGLRRAEMGTPGAGCFRPDIDVDGDGLEAFCDLSPEEEPLIVEKCVDGDGTIVLDEGGVDCTTALDDKGNLRFVDGVSIAITFETVPAMLPTTLN